MAWQHVQYIYPIEHGFEKIILWVDSTCRLYFALKKKEKDAWSYYSGDTTTTSVTSLTARDTEAQAQTNYWRADPDSNGKVVGILPHTFYGKYVRMYIDDKNDAGTKVYEFRPSTRIVADEIITGNLEITDDFTTPPMIKVKSGGVERIKIGNLYGDNFGMVGYDGNAATTFELSASKQTIANWNLFTKTLKSSTTGRRLELNASESRVAIYDAAGNEKVVMGYLRGLSKNASPSQSWGSDDYGFYAADGDHLKIDGNASYISGDWIIKHDAAYKILDDSDNEIIRLGTDSGQKGLFLYNTSGETLAKYHSNGFTIGHQGEGYNYIKYTPASGLDIQGHIQAESITASSLSVTKLSDITANAGLITAGVMISAEYRTSNNATKVVLDNDGMRFEVSGGGGKYGEFKYASDATASQYGTGAIAYLHHSSQRVPFYVMAEQSVADFHFYNRSAKPSGAAELGDVCMVNRNVFKCTTAGTPGTWKHVASIV